MIFQQHHAPCYRTIFSTERCRQVGFAVLFTRKNIRCSKIRIYDTTLHAPAKCDFVTRQCRVTFPPTGAPGFYFEIQMTIGNKSWKYSALDVYSGCRIFWMPLVVQWCNFAFSKSGNTRILRTLAHFCALWCLNDIVVLTICFQPLLTRRYRGDENVLGSWQVRLNVLFAMWNITVWKLLTLDVATGHANNTDNTTLSC